MYGGRTGPAVDPGDALESGRTVYSKGDKPRESTLAGLSRALGGRRGRPSPLLFACVGLGLVVGAVLLWPSGGAPPPPVAGATLASTKAVPAVAAGGAGGEVAALAAAAALDAAAAAAVAAVDHGPPDQPLRAAQHKNAPPSAAAAASSAVAAAAAAADPFALGDVDRGPPLVGRGKGGAAAVPEDESLACRLGGVCVLSRAACESLEQPGGAGARPDAALACASSPSARRAAVASAIRDTWDAYASAAWGADEVRPLTGGRHEWVGMGLTLVDGLDTLLLAGERARFDAAKAWVGSALNVAPDKTVSLFETTIRVVGGLLSAAVLEPALTGGRGGADPLLLARAAELALRLSPGLAPAANGSLTASSADVATAWSAWPDAAPGGGPPYGGVNLLGVHAGGGAPLSDVNPGRLDAAPPAWTHFSSLAEATTLAVELDFLARATGEAAPAAAALAALRRVAHLAAADPAPSGGSDRSVPPPRHLPPMFLDPADARPASSVVTLGARGDSYFEYLLKTWIGRGRRAEDAWMADAYRASMRAVRSHLLHRSAPSDRAAAASEGLTPQQADAGLLYVAEWHAGRVVAKMDHLVCFLPGLLALGAHVGLDTRRPLADLPPGSPPDAPDLDVARDLMATCYAMYRRTPTGLAPEIVHFHERGSGGVAGGRAAADPATASAARDAARDAAAASASAAADAVLASNSVSLDDAAAERLAAGLGGGKPAAGGGGGGGAAFPKAHTPDVGGGAFFIKHPDAHNLLRPEAVESMFILWRVTREERYRDMGWAAFRAFAKWAAVDRPAAGERAGAGGVAAGHDERAEPGDAAKPARSFAALDSVLSVPPTHRDVADSFWLAETLKYLLLLFDDGAVADGGGGGGGGAARAGADGRGEAVPLTSWVFNTEAHALPIAGGPADVAARPGYLTPPPPAGGGGSGGSGGGDEGGVALAAALAAASSAPQGDPAAVAAAAERAAVTAGKAALRARCAAWAAVGTAAAAAAARRDGV